MHLLEQLLLKVEIVGLLQGILLMAYIFRNEGQLQMAVLVEDTTHSLQLLRLHIFIAPCDVWRQIELLLRLVELCILVFSSLLSI